MLSASSSVMVWESFGVSVDEGVERCGRSDGRVGEAVVDSVGALGCRRGDRRRGVGLVARPGVLLRVTRLCRRGVLQRVFGAVGLLDKVGITLGGCMVGTSILGDC